MSTEHRLCDCCHLLTRFWQCSWRQHRAHLYPGSLVTGLSSKLRCVKRGRVQSVSRSCNLESAQM